MKEKYPHTSYYFLCGQRSIDRLRRGVEGHRVFRRYDRGAGFEETGDFVEEKLGGATVVRLMEGSLLGGSFFAGGARGHSSAETRATIEVVLLFV